MTKKEKYLDNAQKFLVKGQLDRAIREYEQAVALDPKDIRVRQKFAELLMRVNRKDDAIREFEVIGKYYADNGFYLKAIAVYKQIQRTDPSNITISLTLASLNEKQGLAGNALAEYKTVYDYYEKTGQLAEGVSVLEKMLAADKDNLNIRLKLADTRHRAGMTEEAYEDFTGLARDLKAKGDEAAFARVCERIGHLFPDRKDFIISVAESQVRNGHPAAAIPLLKQLAADERWNRRALQLLVDAGRAAGDSRLTKGACGELAKRYPDEIEARKGLIDCFIQECNADDGLRYLKSFESALVAADPEAVDGFYRRFAEMLPEHPAVVERFGTQSTTVEEEPQQLHTDDDTADVSTVVAVGAIDQDEESFAEPPSPSSEPAGDEEWEEEIDISFEEDDFVEGNSESQAGELPPVAADATTGAAELFASSESVGVVGPGSESVEVEIETFADVEVDQFPDLALDQGDELVEIEITDPAALMDDWLTGEVSIAESPAGEPAAGVLELDFTEEELDGLIPPPPPEPKRDKYGLDGLFSAFKKGVGEQLDQGDTETHYNLGIAYKEMGLYDDAISEFRAASLDPQRKVDCITLQGICCREKGDFFQAEELLMEGVALNGLVEEELLCLRYELALLHEAMGACEQALGEYREIYAVNPHFRDTIQKIARLECSDEAIDLTDIELVDLDDGEDGVR